MNRPPTNQPNPQVQQARQVFNSLGRGRQITIVAAVLGLIFSFFPWYGASYHSGTISSGASVNGWHSWGWLAILGFIVAGVIVILPLVGVSLRSLAASLPPTVTDARIVIGAGIVALIGALLFIVTGGGYSSPSAPGFSQGPSIGAYVGLLCAIAIIVGGYFMMQEPAAI